LIQRAFEKSGVPHTLKHVMDGEQAVNFLQQAGITSPAPRLIVLDWYLPKVGGADVLSAIRHNLRTLFTPVIILSSSRVLQDRIAGYRLGANSFVLKREDAEEFNRALKAIAVYWLDLNEPTP
jgi:two-component system response regulator